MGAMEIYRDALLEITREQGKVCRNFEICRHEACRSSYTAWAIADKALKEAVNGLSKVSKDSPFQSGCDCN